MKILKMERYKADLRGKLDGVRNQLPYGGNDPVEGKVYIVRCVPYYLHVRLTEEELGQPEMVLDVCRAHAVLGQ